jgi:hypothetical protein
MTIILGEKINARRRYNIAPSLQKETRRDAWLEMNSRGNHKIPVHPENDDDDDDDEHHPRGQHSRKK